MDSKYYNWLELMKRSELNSTSKLVAYCLGSYMNSSNNIAWPSHNTIAKDTSLSSRSVIRAINDLSEKGWFEVIRKSEISNTKGGRQLTNSYTTSVPSKVVTQIHLLGKGSDTQSKGGGTESLKGVTDCHINNNTNTNRISRRKQDKKMPPTLQDVKQYCVERKNSVDAEQFINHYEVGGWMRGKTKIKDWKACVRTWEKNDIKKPTINSDDDYAI